MTTRDKVLTVTCYICKDVHDIQVNSQDYTEWKSGKLIQDAFPYLSVDERELLVSRTCPKCWNKIWSAFEKEDE